MPIRDKMNLAQIISVVHEGGQNVCWMCLYKFTERQQGVLYIRRDEGKESTSIFHLRRGKFGFEEKRGEWEWKIVSSCGHCLL